MFYIFIDLDLQFEILLESWTLKHGINNKSIIELLKILNAADQKGTLPTKMDISPFLSISKNFLICDVCDVIKSSDFCNHCDSKTTTNHFLLLNIREQFKRFFLQNDNLQQVLEVSNDICQLGYSKNSKIDNFHNSHKDSCTLTINTDGMQIFRKSMMDAWPVFLTINELPITKKYAKENIFLPGIWMGQRKLSNLVVLNEMCIAIADLEKGIKISENQIKVFCIYGSFDKPARSTMLNHQSSNAEYGCCFCTSHAKRNGRKVYYDIKMEYNYLTNALITSRMIKSVEKNEPFKGLKGFSPLR